jgi:hypothetical protein
MHGRSFARPGGVVTGPYRSGSGVRVGRSSIAEWKFWWAEAIGLKRPRSHRRRSLSGEAYRRLIRILSLLVVALFLLLALAAAVRIQLPSLPELPVPQPLH